MEVTGTFTIRRYWLRTDTPQEVLNTLNYRWGQPKGGFGMPYVDINYYGDTDKMLTMMELKCADWIHSKEQILYTVQGDDGLGNEDNQEHKES